MSVKVREYTEQDRPVIVRFFEDFQAFLIDIDPIGRLDKRPGYGEAYLTNTLDDIRERSGIFLVAVDENRVIGFIVATILPPIDEVGVIPAIRGRLTELYVDTPSRGTGAGTLLMQCAEDYLKSKGCHFIKIEVFDPNENAHRFYRHLGYRDDDIDMIKRVE